MSPKISIIVPVYKVEEYLPKCIDSILAQTFTDFELILVDDGSPDRCGEICDEYAKEDSRIVVIHKENGGQATARNMGLDIARGEYIGFVDSDDWIEKDMYEILYRLCINNDCEIANCCSTIYYKNRIVVNGGHSLILQNKEEAMKTLLIGELYDECLWTKLISRKLLNGIRIPEGIKYEDTAFTYKVFDRARKIACIGTAKYNYIKRDNSTMDRAIKDICTDAIFIYEDMYQFIHNRYPELVDVVILKLGNSAMNVLKLICKADDFSIHKKKYYEVSRILNSHFRECMNLKDYPFNVKILLAALKTQPMLYRFMINHLVKEK